MGDEFYTLQTIYNIVKSDKSPETYLCSAREIILRQPNDWEVIEKHLQMLAEKNFIVVKQLDKIAISITTSGIEQIKAHKDYDEPVAGFY